MNPSANPTEVVLQQFVDRIPFAKNLSLRVSEARLGFVRTTITPNVMLMNHLGTYQAGVFFTMAEITGGLLLGTIFDLDKQFLITRKSSIIFEAAVNSQLVAISQLEERLSKTLVEQLASKKKLDIIVNVSIKTTENESVAQAEHHYYLRHRMPKSMSA